MIGENIRKHRERCGMDQHDLAKLLNISNKTISSWENGRTEPRMGMIEDMCKIFHISKQELLDDIPYVPVDYDLSSDEGLLVENYRRLDDGSKLRLLQISNLFSKLLKDGDSE